MLKIRATLAHVTKLALVATLLLASTTHATNIQVVYSPGFGHIDPTPVTPVPGNPGTTLGEQRRNVVDYVTRLVERAVWAPNNRPWTAKIEWKNLPGNTVAAARTDDAPVTMTNGNNYDVRVPLTLLTATGDSASAAMRIEIDTSFDFELSIRDPSDADDTTLVATLLHEYVHTLGFLSYTAFGAATFTPSAYDEYVRDARNDLAPRLMTGQQRQALLTAGNDARFVGQSTSQAAGRLLTAGQDSGEVFLHAPTADVTRSAISHVSLAVMPMSVMAPTVQNTHDLDIVAHMLSDIGWGPVVDTKVEATADQSTLTVTVTPDAAATDLLLLITPPIGVTASATASQPATCTPNAGTLECRYASLSAAATVLVDLEGPTGTHEVALDVNHQALHVDPLPANNFARVMVELGSESIQSVTLSSSSIAEGEPAGTVVGNFQVTSTDATASHTFSLVPGRANNDLFQISGARLLIAKELDFETMPNLDIQVRTESTNGDVRIDDFTIQVMDEMLVSENTIQSVALSSAEVAEGEPAGTEVGTFLVTSNDNTLDFTFTLEPGGVNNDYFKIDEDRLLTDRVLDFETTPTLEIRVRTRASNNHSRLTDLEIQVTDEMLDSENTILSVALSSPVIPETLQVGAEAAAIFVLSSDPSIGHIHSLEPGGADNDAFQIMGVRLVTTRALDFDSEPSLDIRIRTMASNGFERVTDFTIQVTDTTPPPENTILTAALHPSSIPEGEPAGAEVGAILVLSLDGSITHTFLLVPNMADNDQFQISREKLLTRGELDFETDPSLDVQVRIEASNGDQRTFDFTVQVTDIAESTPGPMLPDPPPPDPPPDPAPSPMPDPVPQNTIQNVALSSLSIAEGMPAGTEVGVFLVMSSDANTTHTHDFASGGTHNACFRIDGARLLTGKELDFEGLSELRISVLTTASNNDELSTDFTIKVTDVATASIWPLINKAYANGGQSQGTWNWTALAVFLACALALWLSHRRRAVRWVAIFVMAAMLTACGGGGGSGGGGGGGGSPAPTPDPTPPAFSC